MRCQQSDKSLIINRLERFEHRDCGPINLKDRVGLPVGPAVEPAFYFTQKKAVESPVADVRYGAVPEAKLVSQPVLKPVFENNPPVAAAIPKTAPKAFLAPKPIPNYLEKSIEWMVRAQAQSGGWGAGLGSAQNITDPAAVATDPATTAFAGMALIRTGNTLEKGEHHKNLQKALDFLLEAVKNTPADAKNITTQNGTQIQNKLGQNIDVSMTSQFFSHVKPLTAGQPKLEKQVAEALQKCVKIIENAQQANGSWTTSGWAPVLNSAMANNALELAQTSGAKVDGEKMQASQRYQAGNISAEGEVRGADGAGVELYSVSSTQRANGKARQKVEQLFDKNKMPAPTAPAAEIQKELEKQGIKPTEAKDLATGYVAYGAAAKQMTNEAVLTGFGNNGGEEFLSYMMTSESHVTVGGEAWDKWHDKMDALFSKIQNQDGSWNGHHCITSPVFCTAAVIMTLTADRDAKLAAK